MNSLILPFALQKLFCWKSFGGFLQDKANLSCERIYSVYAYSLKAWKHTAMEYTEITVLHSSKKEWLEDKKKKSNIVLFYLAKLLVSRMAENIHYTCSHCSSFCTLFTSQISVLCPLHCIFLLQRPWYEGGFLAQEYNFACIWISKFTALAIRI